MKLASNSKALVVGGGIGGLAAALALRQVGFQVVVFERQHELREVGAGLSLWPNAMKALGKLGLARAVEAVSGPIEYAESRTWRGELLTQAPMGELNRRFGAPSVCVHRADLLATLSGALEEGVVRLGAKCMGFEQDGTGVTARFVDGREERGDLLIGGDGIHSAVRQQVLGDDKLRYVGYTAWRAIAEFEHDALPRGTTFVAWGRGSQFGIFPIGHGRVYWFATMNAPEGAGDAAGGRKSELAERFRGSYPPIEAAIEATEESAILRSDIYDLEPIERWGEGRVTLLGDAAHPTTPNLGQGACLALEDAVVLAGRLKEYSDVVSALRSYEARRRDRTAAITRLSHRLGRMWQAENPLAVGVSYLLARLVPVNLALKPFEWIFGYEADTEESTDRFVSASEMTRQR